MPQNKGGSATMEPEEMEGVSAENKEETPLTNDQEAEETKSDVDTEISSAGSESEGAEGAEPAIELSEGAKEELKTMPAESRGFFGKLYEKIKSSEIVQNVVDRYRVWRGDSVAKRAESKIQNLTKEKEGYAVKAKEYETQHEETQEEFDRVKQKLADIGRNVDPSELKNVEDEIAIYKTKSDEQNELGQLATGKIEDTKEATETYNEKLDDSRRRIAGRFEAKMDLNLDRLDRLQDDQETLQEQIDINNEDVKKFDVQEKALAEELKATKNKTIARLITKTIQDIQSNRGEANAVTGKLQSRNESMKNEMDSLKKKNLTLQEKRNEVLPKNEKITTSDTSAAKLVRRFEIYDTGGVGIDLGRGRTMILNEDGIQDFRADGSIKDIKVNTVDDSVIELFMVVPPDQLKDKLPPEIIARMEKIIDKKTDAKKLEKAKAKGGKQETEPVAKKEQKEKLTMGKIVMEWNDLVGKGSGIEINTKKGFSTNTDLGSIDSVKAFLLQGLATKLCGGDVKKIAPRISARVETFISKL